MKEGKIYGAIAGVMKEITPIAKGSRNKEQGYQYRGIEDVMNALGPILASHRIFVRPEVVKMERSERTTSRGGTLLYSILTVNYHFVADDRSEVFATVIGEGMDSGDKASNKAMAAAYKYACTQMFCIPTRDMSDPDSESPPQSKPAGERQESGQAGEGTADKIEFNALVADIGRILKEESPDRLGYFRKDEIDANRALCEDARKSRDLEAVKKLHVILLKELAKRKAECRPVPHGGDEFKNGIPDGMYKEGEEPLSRRRK